MNNRITYRPDRLRIAREKKGLTLDELGKRIGLSKGTLSRYESGVVSGIRLNTLNEIALILDANPTWLLGESDNEEMSSSQRETLTEFGDLETLVFFTEKSRNMAIDC